MSDSVTITRRKLAWAASVVLAGVVLLVAAAFGGSYWLGLAALHNHNNLSVAQACQHWRWQYEASGEDHQAATRAADLRTLGQLKCRK